MMDKDTWKDALLDVISEIASESYQNSVWLRGDGNDVSSWEEANCRFFDDYDADGFIDKYLSGNEYDEAMKRSFIEFRHALSKYGDEIESSPSPERILSDPKWEIVREFARVVLDKWNERIKGSPISR